MENIFQFKADSNIDSVSEKISEWIFASEFITLLQSFGKTEIQGTSLKSQINELVEFSSIWDFRGRQTIDTSKNTESARWTIADFDFSSQQKENIMRTANKLGLIGCTVPSKKQYDYIFVLGGAMMSCLFRMQYAKEVCDQYGVIAKSIVGLSGMREVMESERDATDTYAPDARTEFDLMESAVERVFGSLEITEKEQHISNNSNESWALQRYSYNIPVILLAAPSGEPDKRRANTADTFNFFRERFNVDEEKNILLVTSQIYVPYQQLEAIRMLGIPYKHSLETIGFPNEWLDGLQVLQKPENYLQEIRSVLQSADRLLIKYY